MEAPLRLIHDGRPSEMLLEGGEEIRRGQEFEVADQRGEYLLEAQPVRLRRVGSFATGGPVPARGGLSTVAQTGGETASLSAALTDGNAPGIAEAHNETPREARTGEAQSTEGDHA